MLPQLSLRQPPREAALGPAARSAPAWPLAWSAAIAASTRATAAAQAGAALLASRRSSTPTRTARWARAM
eukprot:11185860-Lingulodinium_polyedra.AAC.1